LDLAAFRTYETNTFVYGGFYGVGFRQKLVEHRQHSHVHAQRIHQAHHVHDGESAQLNRRRGRVHANTLHATETGHGRCAYTG